MRTYRTRLVARAIELSHAALKQKKNEFRRNPRFKRKQRFRFRDEMVEKNNASVMSAPLLYRHRSCSLPECTKLPSDYTTAGKQSARFRWLLTAPHVRARTKASNGAGIGAEAARAHIGRSLSRKKQVGYLFPSFKSRLVPYHRGHTRDTMMGLRQSARRAISWGIKFGGGPTRGVVWWLVSIAAIDG